MNTPINTQDRASHMDSNHTPGGPSAPRDDRFDAAMRGIHATALDAVSPRVAAQLQQRRRAALSGRRANDAGARRVGWRIGAAVAASFAALLAVSIGLQSPSTDLPQSGAATVVAGNGAASDLPSGPASDGNGDAEDGTILDENPDFYAWLASSDATTLAME